MMKKKPSSAFPASHSSNNHKDANEIKIWRQKEYLKPIDIKTQVNNLNKQFTNKLSEHQFYYTVKEKIVEVKKKENRKEARLRKRKEAEQIEAEEMRKKIEALKNDVRESLEIKKNLTIDNVRYLKQNAEYVKDISRKVRAEFVDRGDKYTLEVNKSKVMKEMFCFQPDKNCLHMIQQSEKNPDESSKFKKFKKSVEKNLDVFLDKNFYKNKYEKQRIETAKTKIEVGMRRQLTINQKLSKSQTAKFYALNSGKVFKRKQLETDEIVKQNEVKSPKEEFLENLDKCINNIPNIISLDNITNFIYANRDDYDLPCAFIDDYINKNSKNNEELKYLSIPEDLSDKNIESYFPQLKDNKEKFSELMYLSNYKGIKRY